MLGINNVCTYIQDIIFCCAKITPWRMFWEFFFLFVFTYKKFWFTSSCVWSDTFFSSFFKALIHFYKMITYLVTVWNCVRSVFGLFTRKNLNQKIFWIGFDSTSSFLSFFGIWVTWVFNYLKLKTWLWFCFFSSELSCPIWLQNLAH